MHQVESLLSLIMMQFSAFMRLNIQVPVGDNRWIEASNQMILLCFDSRTNKMITEQEYCQLNQQD